MSLTTRMLKGKRFKKLTCPYIRLSAEMDEMVGEAPTPSERQEMLLWPDSYKLLRTRGLNKKVPMSAQTAHIYRSKLYFEWINVIHHQEVNF